jgi:hypothetical protein
LTSDFVELVGRLVLDLGNLVGLPTKRLLSHRVAPNVDGLSSQTQPHSFSFMGAGFIARWRANAKRLAHELSAMSKLRNRQFTFSL